MNNVILSSVLAALAAVLAIGQMLPYALSCFRGITKPSRVASSINLTCNSVTTVAMAAAGTRSGMVLPIALVITNLMTLLLAIKYGHARFTKSDMVNASLAAAGLVAYLVFGPYVALIAMAVVLTSSTRSVISKLRAHPGTEDALSWLMVGAAMVFSAAAIVVEGSASVGVLFLPTVSVINILAVSVFAIGPHRIASKLGIMRDAVQQASRPAAPITNTSDLVLGA